MLRKERPSRGRGQGGCEGVREGVEGSGRVWRGQGGCEGVREGVKGSGRVEGQEGVKGSGRVCRCVGMCRIAQVCTCTDTGGMCGCISVVCISASVM